MKNDFELKAVQYALTKINGKWKIPILMSLYFHNKLRFSELQKSIKGIGSKMLSKELKELEKNGLIIRKVENTSPIKITYQLSVYGKTLDEVFKTLSKWGKMHKIKNQEDVHHLNHNHIIDI